MKNSFLFDYIYKFSGKSGRESMKFSTSSIQGFFFFAKRADGQDRKNVCQFLEEWRLAMNEMAMPGVSGERFMASFLSTFGLFRMTRESACAFNGIDGNFISSFPFDFIKEGFDGGTIIDLVIKDSNNNFSINGPLFFHELLCLIRGILIQEKMLPDESRNWDFTEESNRIKVLNIFRSGIPKWINPQKLKTVTPFLKAFFLKANQVLRDAAPKVASAPASVPQTPAPAPVAPVQHGPNIIQMSSGDFSRLSQFAGVYFTPKSGRLEKTYQNQMRTEIEEARAACDNKASTLPEPMSADVNLDAKDYCKAIKLVHIERKAGEAGATLSNLICSGSIGILQGKNIMQFDFRMDEHGELIVILGGKEIQKSQFASAAMKNFYSEMQRMILTGLKDRLVRVSTGSEQIRFAAPGTSPGPRGIPVFSPDVEEINPRTMDDMFVVENGNNAPGVPIGPLIPNETPRIAELLAGTSQIIPEDMKDIKIYQEEIRTVDKKDLKIYVPVHEDDKATVLESVRTGALTASHIFLMKQKGVVKRHGYQPWIKSKPDPRDAAYEAETLNITQRVGSDARETALRNHLLSRRVGRILDTEASLQMYLSDTPAEIKRVRIRTRNGAGYDSTMLLTDDVHHMNNGLTFANGLSDGAAFINSARGLHAQPVQMASGEVGYRVAVTLNIPQQIHYAQGSYVSIAEAVAMLPQVPVVNPAVV